MNAESTISKAQARIFARSVWKNFTFSSAILETLLEFADEKYRRLLAFFPLPDEPEISLLLQQVNKPVYLPVIKNKELEFRLYRKPGMQSESLLQGRYKLLEPQKSELIDHITEEDLLLVPALGCNNDGTRLGKGGGYYDRSKEFLQPAYKVSLLPEKCTGIFFATEEHDLRLDMVITENNTITF